MIWVYKTHLGPTFDHVGGDASPEPLVLVGGVREVKLAILAAKPVSALAFGTVLKF